MKLKKYKKKTFGTYLSRELIMIIIAFIMALITINLVYKKFNATIMPIAESKARKYLTEMKTAPLAVLFFCHVSFFRKFPSTWTPSSMSTKAFGSTLCTMDFSCAISYLLMTTISTVSSWPV